MKEEKQRINELFEDVWAEIPETDRGLIEQAVVDSGVIWHEIGQFADTNGFARGIDENYTRFELKFNAFQLQNMSNEAIKGVIAHELAHIVDLYDISLGKRLWGAFENLLSSQGWVDPQRLEMPFGKENRANEIARGWGLNSEISQKIQEKMIPDREVDVEGRDPEFERAYYQLKCQDCGYQFEGEYQYNRWREGKESRIFMSYKDVIEGIVTASGAVHDEVLLDKVFCPECESREIETELEDREFEVSFL